MEFLHRVTLPTRPCNNALGNKHHVILILHMVIDQHGRLLDGQLVDLEGRLGGRFRGWQDLSRTVRDWLSEQELDGQASDGDSG